MAGSDPECYVYLDRCIFPNLNEYWPIFQAVFPYFLLESNEEQ